MENQSANITRGHSAVNPGLRGHSCGAAYPLVVINVGGKWVAFNCKTGREGVKRRTYQEAEIDLHSILIRNLMHS